MARLEDIQYLEQNVSLTPWEVEILPELLEAAAGAESSPTQSNFHSRAAAINVDGDIVTGGNREYAMSRAYVHSEEAVMSGLLSRYPNVPVAGLGFRLDYSNVNNLLASPCGNCRDVLLEETGPNLLLAAGSNDGGVLVARLGNFLFEQYARASVSSAVKEIELDRRLRIATSEATRAILRATSEYLPANLKNRVYGVALIDASGNIFSGSLNTSAGYDAVSPGVSAVESFRNRPYSQRRTAVHSLEKIIVVGAGANLPHVLYRDRNMLLELDETLQSREEAFNPTPVLLLNLDSDQQIIAVAETTTKEWLPYSFTRISLGLGELATQQLSTLESNI